MLVQDAAHGRLNAIAGRTLWPKASIASARKHGTGGGLNLEVVSKKTLRQSF